MPAADEPRCLGVLILEGALSSTWLTVRRATEYSGIGRTKLYEYFSKLEVRKAGKRTLISQASLDDFLCSLPAFRPKSAPPVQEVAK